MKNIIFDIGGVIVDYKRKTYFDYFNFDDKTKSEMEKIIFSEFWSELSKGHLTPNEFVKILQEKYPSFSKEIEMVMNKNNYKFMIPPFKETLDFIKKLKKTDKKLYVISDIEENTIEYLKEEIEGFEELFDGLVYSCKVDMVKKDGDIFDYTINKFKLNPSETLFIDDVVRNLEQAKKRGIHVFKFKGPQDIPEVETIINR